MVCSPRGSSVHGDSPGKNIGVGCHALLQGIFPTQGSNPGLPHYRQILYHLSHKGSPNKIKPILLPFGNKICLKILGLNDLAIIYYFVFRFLNCLCLCLQSEGLCLEWGCIHAPSTAWWTTGPSLQEWAPSPVPLGLVLGHCLDRSLSHRFSGATLHTLSCYYPPQYRKVSLSSRTLCLYNMDS